MDEPARMHQALSQTGGNVVQAAQPPGDQPWGVALLDAPVWHWTSAAGRRCPGPMAVENRKPSGPLQADAELRHPRGVRRRWHLPGSRSPWWCWRSMLTWPEAMEPATRRRVEPWTLATRWHQALDGEGPRVRRPHYPARARTAHCGLWHSTDAGADAAARGAGGPCDPAPARRGQDSRTSRQSSPGSADGRASRPGPGGCPGERPRPRGSSPLGETLSLPMRLLGHAAPGDILLSPQVGRLLEGWFELHGRRGTSGRWHSRTASAPTASWAWGRDARRSRSTASVP